MWALVRRGCYLGVREKGKIREKHNFGSVHTVWRYQKSSKGYWEVSIFLKRSSNGWETLLWIEPIYWFGIEISSHDWLNDAHMGSAFKICAQFF